MVAQTINEQADLSFHWAHMSCLLIFSQRCSYFNSHWITLHVQSNLINSKSLGLEALFQITCSSNIREVDLNIYNPQK